jgi:Cu/Ag efflux protein CusF
MHKKKTLLLFLSLSLALGAAVATMAQETTPPPPDANKGAERQFVGEVLNTDLASKSITVKASGLDAKGERVEKTMTLPVADAIVSQLEMFKAGDKVTVLWRRDDASQRDLIVAITKGDAAPPKS